MRSQKLGTTVAFHNPHTNLIKRLNHVGRRPRFLRPPPVAPRKGSSGSNTPGSRLSAAMSHTPATERIGVLRVLRVLGVLETGEGDANAASASAASMSSWVGADPVHHRGEGIKWNIKDACPRQGDLIP